MSLCIRPVIETWGESLTYSSRDIDMADLLGYLAGYAHDMQNESIECATNTYGEMEVIWISNGHAFLDFLMATPTLSILETLANDEATEAATSPDDETYQRLRTDIDDLRAIAQTWRKSIDAHDGSLRIYCD